VRSHRKKRPKFLCPKALYPSALAHRMLYIFVSVFTAPVYIIAVVFVLATVVRAPSLAETIMAIIRIRVLERIPTKPIQSLLFSVAGSAFGISTMGSMSNLRGPASGTEHVYSQATTMSARNKAQRRERPGMFSQTSTSHAERADVSLREPVHASPEVWEFPHLDVDSSLTLVKRAVVWHVICAVADLMRGAAAAMGALRPLIPRHMLLPAPPTTAMGLPRQPVSVGAIHMHFSAPSAAVADALPIV
jgi:hypothetical protein